MSRRGVRHTTITPTSTLNSTRSTSTEAHHGDAAPVARSPREEVHVVQAVLVEERRVAARFRSSTAAAAATRSEFVSDLLALRLPRAVVVVVVVVYGHGAHPRGRLGDGGLRLRAPSSRGRRRRRRRCLRRRLRRRRRHRHRRHLRRDVVAAAAATVSSPTSPSLPPASLASRRRYSRPLACALGRPPRRRPRRRRSDGTTPRVGSSSTRGARASPRSPRGARLTTPL